jgi:putative flippase GtrA
MQTLIVNLYTKHRNLILYGIIGFCGAGIDFLVFAILYKYLHVYYLWANLISVSFGITKNYILNTIFNFKTKDKFWLRFLSYYGIGLLGMGISSLLLVALVEVLHLATMVAKIISAGLTVIIQYNLNKHLTFKRGYRETTTQNQSNSGREVNPYE